MSRDKTKKVVGLMQHDENKDQVTIFIECPSYCMLHRINDRIQGTYQPIKPGLARVIQTHKLTINHQ